MQEILACSTQHIGGQCALDQRIQDQVPRLEDLQGEHEAIGHTIWEFPKSKGTILRVPIIRTVVAWESIFGFPYLGKVPCWEMMQAESAILHDSNAKMVDEDRYCLEMAKAEPGGLSTKASTTQFAMLLADPSTKKKTEEIASGCSLMTMCTSRISSLQKHAPAYL